MIIAQQGEVLRLRMDVHPEVDGQVLSYHLETRKTVEDPWNCELHWSASQSIEAIQHFMDRWSQIQHKHHQDLVKEGRAQPRPWWESFRYRLGDLYQMVADDRGITRDLAKREILSEAYGIEHPVKPADMGRL